MAWPRRRGRAQCTALTRLSFAIVLLAIAALLTLSITPRRGATDAPSVAQTAQGNPGDAAREGTSGRGRNNAGDAAREGTSGRGKYNAGDAAQQGIAIVVMPSPPMVKGPMNRIDRLIAISETWGQDFLTLDSTGAAAGATAGLDNGNRLVFVMEEDDAFAAEAVRLWGVQDEDSSQAGQQQQLGADISDPRNTPRVLVVPSEVSGRGADGDSRMRHVLATTHFRYDPDFLFFCNEHTFVIPENLLCFVKSLNPAEAVYLGNRFRQEPQQKGAMLNSGAAGFVLSRESLKRLKAAWGRQPNQSPDGSQGGGSVSREREVGGGTEGGSVGNAVVVDVEVQSKCVAHSRFEKDNPGVTLARCLNHLGIGAQDTTDDQGGQRFNTYGPVRLAEGKIDQWYKDVHASKPGLWIAGSGCCSEDTVSFHYVGPAEAMAMHELLHDRERYLTVGYTEAFSLWPSNRIDLGAYAAAPSLDDPSTFDLLLRKIKLCRV